MGLGKTITCVALMASTLASAREYSERPLTHPQPPSDPPSAESALTPAHFSGSVWGMPEQTKAPPPMSAKAKAKAQREFDRADAEYARACRIKANSRATLIICPLSTVSNWEDQFKEHWRGEVTVVGGASGVSCAAAAAAASSSASSQSPSASASWTQLLLNGTPMPEAEVKTEVKTEVKQEAASSSGRVREGPPLRVYVYHGNSRRPDPAFLADFDAVITTYSTLATEYSKQVKSIMPVEEDEGDGGSSDDCVETDEQGNLIGKAPKPKKSGVKKRKKTMCPNINGSSEATSPLQSVSWFRVVLDEAQ